MKMTTRLAVGSIQNNRSRSVLTGIAVFLASSLLTIVLICGTGILQDQKANAGNMYGTWYGTYFGLGEETAQKLKLHGNLQQTGLFTKAAAAECRTADISLRYMDRTMREYVPQTFLEGSYPEQEDEIAGSASMFRHLGVEEARVGSSLTVSYRIGGKGDIRTQNFVISGLLADNEAEVLQKTFSGYLSQAFVNNQIPVTERRYSLYFRLSDASHITVDEAEAGIIELGKQFGIEEDNVKVNQSYLIWELDSGAEILLVCAALCLLVVIFSVLVIVNMFQLGIIRRIQEYGKIKAVGASAGQLKQIVRTEGFILAVPSVGLGLLAGYLISELLYRFVFADMYSQVNREYVQISLFRPEILLLVCLLSFAAVGMAMQKPVKTVCAVSPLEAVRFSTSRRGRHGHRKGANTVSVRSLMSANLAANPRRSVVTILTMGLAGILFVVAANVAGNISAENAARSHFPKGDFMIQLDYRLNDDTYPENNLNRLQEKLLLGAPVQEELLAINGVTAVETGHAVPVALKTTTGETEYFSIRTVSENEYGKLLKTLQEGGGSYEEAVESNGVIYMYGIENLQDILGGDLGDTLDLNVLDGSSILPYRVTVTGTSAHGGLGDFLMTEDTFASMGLQVDTAGELYIYCDADSRDVVKAELEAWVMADGRESLRMTDYRDSYKSYSLLIDAMRYGAYGLLAVIGLIGFMNMANTLITSIITRKRELSMLHAVGMSGQQLNRMLQLEGLIYSVSILALSLTVGNTAGYFLFELCRKRGFVGMEWYHFPLKELAAFVLVVLLLQTGLSWVTVRAQNWKEAGAD